MKIYEKIQIGEVTVPNRLVRAAVVTQTGSPEGRVTDATIAHYKARAGGNLGLIVTGMLGVHVSGKGIPSQLMIDTDEAVESLRRLTEAVHEAGPAKIFAQIAHCGSKTDPRITGAPLMGPSAVMNRGLRPGQTAPIPEEMTKDQIWEVEDAFILAAQRAVRAGFDGVELHAAHAYLLNQFYSPLTNLREDEYGGSLENRLRITTEILRGVRESVGSKTAVSVRFGACDYMEGGSTLEDAARGAALLEEAGADLIDASGGMCRYILQGRTDAGYFRDMTRAIKGACKIPVVLSGGVHTAEEAEALLQEGAADLIGAARVLLQNPKWPEQEEVLAEMSGERK